MASVDELVSEREGDKKHSAKRKRSRNRKPKKIKAAETASEAASEKAKQILQVTDPPFLHDGVVASDLSTEGAGTIAGEEVPTETAGGKRKRRRKRTTKAPNEKRPKDGCGSSSTSNSSNSSACATGDKVKGTVYVEGISYEASEGDVRAFFEQVGNVAEVRMPRYQDTGRIRGYAHVAFGEGAISASSSSSSPPSSKFVAVPAAAAAAAAIAQLDGMRLMGRYLKIAWPKPTRGGMSVGCSHSLAEPASGPPPNCRTIFLKNLPYDCDEGRLRRCMEAELATAVAIPAVGSSSVGEGSSADGGNECEGARCRVVDVRLGVEQGRLKGFGYVEFSSPEGTTAMVAASRAGRLILGERRLFVDYDAVARPKGSFRRVDGRLWERRY